MAQALIDFFVQELHVPQAQAEDFVHEPLSMGQVAEIGAGVASPTVTATKQLMEDIANEVKDNFLLISVAGRLPLLIGIGITLFLFWYTKNITWEAALMLFLAMVLAMVGLAAIEVGKTESGYENVKKTFQEFPDKLAKAIKDGYNQQHLPDGYTDQVDATNALINRIVP